MTAKQTHVQCFGLSNSAHLSFDPEHATRFSSQEKCKLKAISCKWYKSTRLQGWILKFQKGGAGSRILERGGRNLTFQCRFPSFSYKSLTNIPPKGGALARPAPPLNPRLAFRSLRFAPVAQGSFAPSALTRVLRTQLQIPSAFGARLFFIYLFIKKTKLPKKICESTCNKSTVAGLL